MLTKFAVTNYRGFDKRIEWDLSHPANYEFNKSVIKDGIIKNGIIYGPNGSGKTNFSLAIFDIENHLSQKWKKIDYYINFVYAGNNNEVVKFEYTFKFDNDIIDYLYAKNASGVLVEESLFVNRMNVFERKDNLFRIDKQQFPMDESIEKNFESNANNVSVVNFLLTSYPLNSEHYLIKLNRFVNSMLWFRNLDVREFIGLETSLTMLDEFIITNNLLEDFADFLQEVSGQTFCFVVHSLTDKQILCRIDKREVPFRLVASTGTQSLQLLYFWLKRMDEASFVFIDEFDAFYHFRLAFEVCKQLFALDCQIFTSSHNTYLMTNELLRPDCNFILNNNKIKCLADCTDKELRFGHNIEKIYRAGVFCHE
ncbi:AAA family ATPase [Odoribacter splanchnicus]|uniref:AAA family ATPase n=1 Tax=Odoribacter splanchnicus TaxID=28118 RepID=UPI0034BB7282